LDFAHCDVGLKAIYRSIRRLVRSELETIREGCGAAQGDNAIGGAFHAKLLCYLSLHISASAEQINNLAELLLAFDLINHVKPFYA
jgi:hypothetical protein